MCSDDRGVISNQQNSENPLDKGSKGVSKPMGEDNEEVTQRRRKQYASKLQQRLREEDQGAAGPNITKSRVAPALTLNLCVNEKDATTQIRSVSMHAHTHAQTCAQ